MLNETELILNAFRMSAPVSVRSKKMNDIEPDPTGVDSSDAILGLAKRERQRDRVRAKRAKRRGNIAQWTNLDFLRYADEALKVRGMRIESLATRDSEIIASLYDKFVDLLPGMNNGVLKDYIDWWVACKSPGFHNKEIYAQTLSRDYFVETFLNRYESSTPSPTAVLDELETTIVPVDLVKLYRHGGITMLLISEGIVDAYSVVQQVDKEAERIVSEALLNLTEEELSTVINVTQGKSPYNKESRVDLIQLAKPALEKHNVDKFNHVLSTVHFKS